jgi:hypothetical protein
MWLWSHTCQNSNLLFRNLMDPNPGVAYFWG